MQTFDLSILRTLIAVVETGNFARAAQRVNRSESAVSLQLKRLEEQVAQAVFHRAGRKMVLTDAGLTLLAYARRLLDLNDEALTAMAGSTVEGTITLGVPQDFAETWLPAIVARFARAHPAVTIRTIVDRSPALLARLDRGEIDLAMGFANRKPARALWSAELPMAWIGPRDFSRAGNEPIQLAVFDPPCAFRTAAVGSLERAGIGWSVAFASPSLAGLWAAVNAGLGITVRTPTSLPPNLVVLRMEAGMPELPVVALALYGPRKSRLAPAVDRLRQVLTDTLDASLVANL